MLWHAQPSYEFGPFRVDTRERQLLRAGEVVPLTPKVFDVLLTLIQNRGHILTKDQVINLVWPNTAVEEGNVARNISTLRSALGERPQQHQYIETIPWRGYRFVANVREVNCSSAGPAIDSLAVLPFVAVNDDLKDEYLLDGLAETLITFLAQLSHLRVISRNSSFRYKGREPDAQTLGRELKVQAVLMGRIAQVNDLVSISLELVDCRDDRHIWGAQYIRKPSEFFSAHETISREVAQKLSLELTNHEERLLTKRHTSSNEAYLLYLKGRYHFHKLTPDGVPKGIEYFQQAIDRDPNYSLAYAALADCHNYLAHPDEAKTAILKALELDENLGEAHATLGFFKFLYDWDFAGAQCEFERALALSPNYAEAHHWYAIYLANLGRHAQADREGKRAVELDPLSLMMNMTAALNFYLAREHDRAIEQLRKVIEMEPNFVAARSVMGSVLVQKGLYEEAMSEYQKVMELIKGAKPVEVSVNAIMAHAYGRWGKRDDALRLLEEVISAGTGSPYSIAGIYTALGDRDSAFEWLNKAFVNHDLQLVSLKVDPSLDGLRDDARFNELTGRVGLPAD